jgi:hypothetical protein
MATKARDDTALSDAYEQQIRLMFDSFVSALCLPNANVEEACNNFRRGIALARKTLELATNIMNEQPERR